LRVTLVLSGGKQLLSVLQLRNDECGGQHPFVTCILAVVMSCCCLLWSRFVCGRVPTFAACSEVLFPFIKPTDDVIVGTFNVATHTVASN